MTTTETVVRGIPVTVINTRAEIKTEDVVRRLDLALGLIEQHTPHYYRHLRRDFSRIGVKRYATRGAYFSATGTCLVELTFAVNPEFSLAQVAALIVHEAMHARLHRIGLTYDASSQARHERFCRRAEVKFGRSVPGGEPVVERALDVLDGSDDEVTVDIDWSLAARRVAEADLRASKTPLWFRRWVAKRRGLTFDE